MERKIFMLFIVCAKYMDIGQGSYCRYEVLNCHREEFICGDEEKILLASKSTLDGNHCFAIKHVEYENLNNYEINVDMLSLESNEGIISGHLGVIFNFLDPMNYDFVYLE